MTLPENVTDKITWLFLLLPGFLSLTVASLIVDIGGVLELQLVLYSFALTLIDLAIVFPLILASKAIVTVAGKALAVRTKGPDPEIQAEEAKGWWKSQDLERTWFYTITFVVSIITGIVVGIVAEKDWFYDVANSFKFIGRINTETSKRPLAYLLYLNDAGQLNSKAVDGRHYSEGKYGDAYVRLLVKGNRIYEGWPRLYDLRRSGSEIYLTPACELSEIDGKTILHPIVGPGILVYEREIVSIYFLDRSATNCRSYWVAEPAQRADQFPNAVPIGKDRKPPE